MASSNIAKSKLFAAKRKALGKKTKKVSKGLKSNLARYGDTGTTGAKKHAKEDNKVLRKAVSTNDAINKKTSTDFKNIGRYGKDAMKSRGFATMPNTKAKTKAKPKAKAKKK